MHPAFSVIFFTTASGAGYGLLFLLCLLGAAGRFPPDPWFGVIAFGLAFGLVSAGLLSSTFHLGHPERAWRAFTQWRSSWLSREGVAAIVTYVPTGVFAAAAILLGRTEGIFAAVAIVGALSCAVTVYCTAKIYASLRAIPRWTSAWVVPGYLLLGLATGALLLTFLTHVFGAAQRSIDSLTFAAFAAAALVKTSYWRSMLATSGESTAASATGLGRPGLVRLLDAPHTESNYLLQEMGYRVARRHADRLRIIAGLLLFAVPLASTLGTTILGPGTTAVFVAGISVLSASIGVLIERWLFFAEARHTVTLYYGENTA